MAGIDQPGETAPKQADGPTMAAPPAPSADLGAQISSISARTETRREKRRREWHEGKIRKSREKKLQHNQATTPQEQIGHRDPQHAEPMCTCASAQKLSCLAAGGKRRHPSHGRTDSQWEVIEELRLCAGCLTRTTPPHKPADGHAPCTGQPNAPFEDAKIAMIRKALDRLEAEHRRRERMESPHTTCPQRNRQWRPGDASSNGSQHTLCSGGHRDHRYPDAGHGRYESGPSGHTHDTHAISEGGLSSFAPLYNLRNSSSFLQPRVGLTPLSSGFVPPATGLAYPSSSAYPHIVDTAGASSPQATGSSPGSEDLLVGMTPATPLISTHPGELIEEDLGPIDEHAPLITVVRDYESGGEVPKLKVEDWDTLTKVPDGLPEDLIPDVDTIVKKMLQLGDRSWTLQGLCSSLDGSECGESTGTLVDEPQEILSKQTADIEEVIQTATSVELRRNTR